MPELTTLKERVSRSWRRQQEEYAHGFTAGYVLAPRTTRLAAATLVALAGSDFLQLAYAYAEQHAS
jgi:hypothetical protein